MRVANIIIAHKNPGQLLRLIQQFSGDKFQHFIHIDGRCNLNDYRSILDRPDVTVVKKRRKPVWGGNGFLLSTLEAIRTVKSSNEKFFYYNLMSGMDFPIRPTQELFTFLEHAYKTEKREFFEIIEMKDWGAQHRYVRYHFPDVTIKGRYFVERWISRLIGPRSFYSNKMIPYGRSAWFTATNDFIDYALDFMDKNPSYLKYLMTTWSSDEFCWNTLIMNSPFKNNLAEGYLRYIDWSAGGANPKTFTTNDLDRILASGQFLARKFDETVDNEILIQLEEINASK